LQIFVRKSVEKIIFILYYYYDDEFKESILERKIKKFLQEWKQSSDHKPLLLQGARQVGKTYSLEQFGRQEFKKYFLFDFMENPSLNKVFEQDLLPERILRDLGILMNDDIDLDHDLIIFDEIQQCPNALTSLKYFAQKLPNAYIAATGSLLGLGLSENAFPVGKVDRMNLYPMDFEEFLMALDQKRLIDYITSLSVKYPINEAVHLKIWTYFKYYMICGGLPEIVEKFIEKVETPSEGFRIVRKRQKELIKDYLDDIAKHSGKLKSVRIEAVFKNIPIQLAKETSGIKKFVFKDVLPNNSRYALLEGPIEWLIRAGLILKVPICNKAVMPLQAYTDEKKFKLYMFDIGILGCMIDLSPQSIFSYDYGSYKGYFAENVVLTEMVAQLEKTIYSWTRNSSEIEFLTVYSENIIPIEVKAGLNTKAKSLKVFNEKYSPKSSILFSGRPIYSFRDNRMQLPLYLAGWVKRVLKII
jgi:predicted AAA+ superfamily ATPase